MSLRPRTYQSLWHGVRPWPRPMAAIAAQVAAARGVPIADLRGRAKGPRVSAARQEFMALTLAERRFGPVSIGRWLDGRDHTTVLYGARAHEARHAG